MSSRHLRLPSPSMIVAALALSISLGGTGYAATSLATHQATSAAHKPKATKPLSSSQVNKLIAAYLARNRGRLRGGRGAAGPKGATGPVGPAGEAGTAGLKGEVGATGAAA